MRIFLFIVFTWGCLSGETANAQNNFRVMFYNVENLFDCTHDSLKNDREFLPESVRGWNYKRYKQKINSIAKVICAAGEWELPDLIGLCEVENEKVVNDLTNHSPLKEQGYRFVMTDSPDERGIDVALLYQRGSFKLLNHRSIRIDLPNRKPTRDILHVTGIIANGDTLDVFVVHLPSRSGGEKESEPARLAVASKLKTCADSLFRARRNPNLIITGDFNDYPYNRSVCNVLNANFPARTVEPLGLYNLMAGKKGGTYKYQGEWGILDQFIVSGTLLIPHKGLTISANNVSICQFPFLLEADEKYGGKQPFRTYYGFKYIGGFSDHLPIIGKFEWID